MQARTGGGAVGVGVDFGSQAEHEHTTAARWTNRVAETTWVILPTRVFNRLA